MSSCEFRHERKFLTGGTLLAVQTARSELFHTTWPGSAAGVVRAPVGWWVAEGMQDLTRAHDLRQFADQLEDEAIMQERPDRPYPDQGSTAARKSAYRKRIRDPFPTSDMLPASTLNNAGNSSMLVWRRKRPTRVTRCSAPGTGIIVVRNFSFPKKPPQ